MQFAQIERRAFITLLGGALASPLAARAQAERLRLVGILSGLDQNDPEEQARIASFRKGLQQLGWTEGRNLRIERRSTRGDAKRAQVYAAELATLAPDVIVTAG